MEEDERGSHVTTVDITLFYQIYSVKKGFYLTLLIYLGYDQMRYTKHYHNSIINKMREKLDVDKWIIILYNYNNLILFLSRVAEGLAL